LGIASPLPNNRIARLLLCTALLAFPARVGAQSALVVFGHGAYYAPLADLSDDGDDFASRFAFGLGVAAQIGQSVALRLSGTFVNTRYRGDALAVSDSSVARLYGMGDIQIGFPGTTSFVPYLILGAGVVRSDFRDPTVAATSYPAMRFGGGFNYVSSIGAFFLEVLLTGHRHTGVPFSSTQMDVAIQIGFAIAMLKIG